MKSKITNHATIIIGLLLLAVSLYLIKTSNDPQGIMRTLPYVCIGIGCGLFGHGMGNVISERAINSYPELKRQLDIEKNDERNVAIANRAKGKAFDMMTFVFGALMLSFGLIDGKDIIITKDTSEFIYVRDDLSIQKVAPRTLCFDSIPAANEAINQNDATYAGQTVMIRGKDDKYEPWVVQQSAESGRFFVEPFQTQSTNFQWTEF